MAGQCRAYCAGLPEHSARTACGVRRDTRLFLLLELLGGHVIFEHVDARHANDLAIAGSPALSGQVEGKSLCCSLQGMAEEKLYPCKEKIVAHARK